MLKNFLKILLALSVLALLTSGIIASQVCYNADIDFKTLIKDIKQNDYDLKKVKKRLDKTPSRKVIDIEYETEAFDNNQVYILYKYGCPHCEDVYKYVRTKFKSDLKKKHTTIHFVNVKSDLGKYLIQTYKLQQASSMVYVADKYQNQIQVFGLTDDAGNVNTTVIDNVIQQSQLKAKQIKKEAKI